MPFSHTILRYLQLLLLPLSLPMYAYIYLRHLCYSLGWLHSTRFGLPVICIGNLSVGGTGKSPMTEYLLEMLLPQHKVAVLSRGYGRSTVGYLLAQPGATAAHIGDEPLQILTKYTAATVAVGEQRVPALQKLLAAKPGLQVVLLDDAFQHRAIAAGLNILLTTWQRPYWQDYVLPAGQLRDVRQRATSAQVIVVTKCPPELSLPERDAFARRVRLQPGQQLFFATLAYGTPYHLFTRQPMPLAPHQGGLLLTGIAHPQQLQQYLARHSGTWQHLAYADHHPYTVQDIDRILESYHSLPAAQKIILTTEKDAMRLCPLLQGQAHLPIYALPVAHRFLFEAAPIFEQRIWQFINTFSTHTAIDHG